MVVVGKDRVLDELKMYVWLNECAIGKPINIVNLSGENLELFTDDGKIVESMESASNKIDKFKCSSDYKTLKEIASKIYSCDVEDLKFRSNEVILSHYPKKSVDFNNFVRDIKNYILTKIEYECILNDVPYFGIARISRFSIPILLGVYNSIKDHKPTPDISEIYQPKRLYEI